MHFEGATEFLAEIAKDNIDQMQQQKDMPNAFLSWIDCFSDWYQVALHRRALPASSWTDQMALTQATIDDDRYYPQFSLDNKQWKNHAGCLVARLRVKWRYSEYVVDKATKILKPFTTGIHEVRMRFELCAKATTSWNRLPESHSERSASRRAAESSRAKLVWIDEEFAFVARV